MSDTKLHGFDIGGKLMVCNYVGIPLYPDDLEANKKLENIKIGDKVQWHSTRCVGKGYDLSAIGGKGYVFDISDRHVYTIQSCYETLRFINGFVKSSLGSLGFEIIESDCKNGLELTKYDINDYNDYVIKQYTADDNKNIQELVPKREYYSDDHRRTSIIYIDSSTRYDYFVERDIYEKSHGVAIFARQTRPSDLIL